MEFNVAQKGIFYEGNNKFHNTHCMVFFNFAPDCTKSQAHNILKNIWKIVNDLKNGIIQDLLQERPTQHHSRNIEFILGYSNNIFSINGINAEKPEYLYKTWFRPPDKINGGGKIIDNDANIHYRNDIKDNHALTDTLALQCIAEDQEDINIVIIEIIKALEYIKKSNNGHELIKLSKCYFGYNNANKRNVLQFYDGISNIKKEERKDVIFMKKNNGEYEYSTYMVWSRIEMDMKRWINLSRDEQEMIMGRDLITGCPIIGYNKLTGKPLKDPECPVQGTSSVLDPGNEKFREINPYVFYTYNLPTNYSPMKSGHAYNSRINGKKHSGIYRQGFNYLSVNGDNDITIGLNFISFQNDVRRFFNVFKHSISELGKYCSIISAGVYFIPKTNKNELFPGEEIFFK